LIALHTYLDSSGKLEKEEYLTLAAVVGNNKMWEEFEGSWAEILDNHIPKAEYVHMREILRLEKGFDSSLGWNEQNSFDLVTKCVGYMSRLDKARFRMFYCSVDLKAWSKLRGETYQMPNPVDMCNTFCSEIVLGWYLRLYPDVIDPHNDTVKYFFDRTEYLEGSFRDKWNTEKNLAEGTGEWSIWQRIDEITCVDMKKTPGIQAADIIAWAVNRETFAKEGQTAKYLGHILRQVIPSYYVVWDETKMKKQFRPLLHLS